MFNKIKKVILCSTAAALFLTSCGSKDDSSDENKGESTAGGKISVQVQTEWMDHYEKAAERVKEKYPDFDIELKEVAAFDHLDVFEQTDATNEDVADVFAIPTGLASLDKNVTVAPLDVPRITDELGGFENIDDGISGSFKFGDDYLAVPFNIESLITFVNTKNAEDEAIDLNETIELNSVKKPETILYPMFDCWYGVAATNSSGIELLDKDEDQGFVSDMVKDFNDLEKEKQRTIESLYKYWDLHSQNNTPLFDPDAGWSYIDESFKVGNGGVARLGGPWDTATISEQVGEENLDVFSIGKITVNGKALKHWKSGWGLAVNARIEDDEEKMKVAEEMIKEIVNPDYAVDLFKSTGKVLENVDKEVYQESDLPEIDKKVIVATIDSYNEAPSRPLFEEWDSVWDTWKNAVLSWNAVKPQDEVEAYNELKASFESMIATFK